MVCGPPRVTMQFIRHTDEISYDELHRVVKVHRDLDAPFQ